MNNHIWPPYWGGENQYPCIKIVKTRGSFIFDDNKTKIFDGISSWWSVCHGYNHPKIVKSMQKCLNAMPHVMFGGITHNYAESLSQLLYKFSNNKFAKTFFCDSGSVAVEVSIKMALQYWQELHRPQKTHILTFSGSYHGETFMASAVSGDEKSHISSYTNNVINLKLPSNKDELKNVEIFLEKNHNKIACSILEPIMQGAVGIKFYSAEILHDLFTLIKKYDILFITDECATGFYRTGRRFGFDHAEITPDITILGKALSGGHIPLAAVCTTDMVFSTICTNGHFRHGPTFMANPLACSAAIASMQIFHNYNYVQHVARMSEAFQETANNLKAKLGLNARILGGVIAVEINPHCNVKKYIAENIAKHKLWVRPIGNTLYMMPPLNVEMLHLNIALEAFEAIIKNTHMML